MPSQAFTLQVPADAKYTEIAGDAARKFVELMGGAEAEGTAFAAALSDAIQRLSGRGAAALEFAFSLQPGSVEVIVTAGSHSSVVHHPIAAGRR